MVCVLLVAVCFLVLCGLTTSDVGGNKAHMDKMDPESPEYQTTGVLMIDAITYNKLIPNKNADIVLMVYRDEMYNPETKDKGIAEVIVAKNRAGSRGTVKLAWIGSQTKFAPLEQNYQGESQPPPPAQ